MHLRFHDLASAAAFSLNFLAILLPASVSLSPLHRPDPLSSLSKHKHLPLDSERRGFES